MARRVDRIPKSEAYIYAVVALALGFVLGYVLAPKGDEAKPKKVSAAAEKVLAEPTPGEGEAGKGAPVYKERLDVDPSPSKGPADAPIVIYELSDFQCPFCKKATDTLTDVIKAYPNDVRVVWKNRIAVPGHKDAPLAARAAHAAGRQGKFWAYHDQLWANMTELKKDSLIEYAGQIGLDVTAFKKDLDDPKIKLKVDNDNAAGELVGVTSTPFFFINGVAIKGAQPLAKFKEEIDRQLEKVKALASEGAPREKIARALTAEALGDKAAAFLNYVIDEQPAPLPKPPETDKQVWKVSVDNSRDHIKGKNDAPITITEFSDFQ